MEIGRHSVHPGPTGVPRATPVRRGKLSHVVAREQDLAASKGTHGRQGNRFEMVPVVAGMDMQHGDFSTDRHASTCQHGWADEADVLLNGLAVGQRCRHARPRLRDMKTMRLGGLRFDTAGMLVAP